MRQNLSNKVSTERRTSVAGPGWRRAKPEGSGLQVRLTRERGRERERKERRREAQNLKGAMRQFSISEKYHLGWLEGVIHRLGTSGVRENREDVEMV